MSNDNEICSVCQQHPEDILMLECTHDLCVNCAAEIYAKANKKTSIFVCEICLAQTILDRETITCLQNASREMRRSMHQPVPVATVPPASLPPAPPKPTLKSSSLPNPLCAQHKQQLLYYCFDCKSSEICAECILLERHRGHQVSTFKKAANHIVKLLENDIKEKELHRNKIANDKKKITEGFTLFRSQVEARRKELRIFFDELTNLVTAHSQRLAQQLDDMTMSCEAAIRGQLDITECKISEVNLEIERLHQVLKESDKSSFFKYYKKPVELRNFDYRLDTVAQYIEIDYPKQDIIDELMQMLQRITIKKERPLGNSRAKHFRTEGGHTKEPSLESEEKSYERSIQNTNAVRSTKKQLETTPSRPELKHSLDMASNIISKLQTRQKRFE